MLYIEQISCGSCLILLVTQTPILLLTQILLLLDWKIEQFEKKPCSEILLELKSVKGGHSQISAEIEEQIPYLKARGNTHKPKLSCHIYDLC